MSIKTLDYGLYCDPGTGVLGFRTEDDRRFWLAFDRDDQPLKKRISMGVMDDFGTLVETRHIHN